MTSRRAFLSQGILLFGTAALADDPVGAPRQRIYIAADDHTDYMWTADERTYRQAFLDTIDHYLRLADSTETSPSDFQSRWNCDGLLWLREYELHRSPAQVARLIRRLKSRHLSVPMTMLVSCYGGTPTEAVLRGLYYGGIVERRYDLRLNMAVSMENQTLPLGLSTLWAGSGIRYSWKGVCGCASKVKHNGGRRKHDVYWWVGPDESRILMKWYSLSSPVKPGVYANEGPGGYAEARYAEAAIEHVSSDPAFRRRNPHEVIGLFGQGWDDLKTIVPLRDSNRSFPSIARRCSDQSRRIIVSSETDYFEDMEKTHGDDLPEQSEALGNEWDLYSASLAEVSAKVRRATEKLRSAEAMGAIIDLQHPGFTDDMVDQRHECWIAFGLYWEHDWTADGPISRQQRANWQRKIASQISDYVDALYDRCQSKIGEVIQVSSSIPPGPAGAVRHYVFNPLSWVRTDVVEFALPESLSEPNSFSVFPAGSHQAIPSQLVWRQGKPAIQFIASDVPALGWKLFDLRPTATAAPVPATPVTAVQYQGGQLVSSSQTVQVGLQGAIETWVSSCRPKPLIESPMKANRLNDGEGKRTLQNSGPVSSTVLVEIDAPLRRKTLVTVFETLDRIEIENVIEQNFSELQDWSFEFQIDHPKVFHEEVGAVLRAASQSDGGDYGDVNARTDWLTLNHFITMNGDDVSITLSNRDCLFFHLGDDLDSPMDSRSNRCRILAGGQVDGDSLGIQNQGGDRRFHQRFALHAASTPSNTESMKRSLEFQNPFVSGPVTSSSVLSGFSESPFRFESDTVLVWACKVAEDGSEAGTIFRLWNLADHASRYTLTSPTIASAREVTHVETDLGEIEWDGNTIEQTIPAKSFRTILVRFKEAVNA